MQESKEVETKETSIGITEDELVDAGVTKDGVGAVLGVQKHQYIFRHKIPGITDIKRTYKNGNVLEKNWFITIVIPDYNKKFWNKLDDALDDDNLQLKTIHETAKIHGYKLNIAWVEGLIWFPRKRIFFMYIKK